MDPWAASVGRRWSYRDCAKEDIGNATPHPCSGAVAEVTHQGVVDRIPQPEEEPDDAGKGCAEAEHVDVVELNTVVEHLLGDGVGKVAPAVGPLSSRSSSLTSSFGVK